MIIRGRLTALPADTPVSNGTSGELRRTVDNSLITTVTTTDGWYTYEQNGSPGPFYVQWTYGGVTHQSYSRITGPSAATDVGNLPLAFQAFTNGMISGVGAVLAVTATGAGMNITVGAGAAIVQGILYDRLVSSTVAIAAAHATLGRLDYVVVRVVPRGAGETIEGKSELAIITGTPSATPVLPTLTQTSALYEYPIGSVTVDPAVTTIASNKVSYSSTNLASALPSAGAITATHLSLGSVTSFAILNGTITGTDIAAGTVTSSNILDGTILTADLNSTVSQNLAVIGTVYEGATLKGSRIGQLTFDAADFNVTVAGAQATVELAASSGNPTLMPGSQFVATGSLSSGTRTLITLAIGPLLSGVQYAISCQAGVTLRGTGSTGTTAVRTNINGGTQGTIEYQHVGGVPRWAPVDQTTLFTGTGATIDVTCSVQFLTGDPGDIRAGKVLVTAIPT